MPLLWVHFTFMLYFFFAEYTYVSDNIDSLTIGRMYFFRSRADSEGKKIEKFLFKLIIPADIFEELLQVNQPFARDIIQQLSNRLRKIYLPATP